MNPSASGWIDKLNRFIEKEDAFAGMSWEAFYVSLRASGFIYGANIATVIAIPTELKLSEAEITKVNLYLSLVFSYQQQHPTASTTKAVEEIANFYNELNVVKFSFLNKILIGKDAALQLEKVIDSRIRINSNLFKQNFSNIITNALLFSDVLGFIHFLEKKKDTEAYAVLLENHITEVVFQALNTKTEKSEYDELLIKLVASSMRYDKQEDAATLLEGFGGLNSDLRTLRMQQYIVDLTCMAVWDDETLDKDEEHFLWSLSERLQLSNEDVEASLQHIQDFIAAHRDKIAFFNAKNPVKAFYDQSSKAVSKLILRNKKRLTKELSESGELMVLLTRSTVRDLTEEEKQKVKEQLLDICKSVPSLAIFALPGGAILLPLLVKFIPKLLPSAFNDNKIVDE